MLRSTHDMVGYGLAATDGDIGRVKDFLFDERNFRVRHLVASTGTWLPGRKVVLPPPLTHDPDWQTRSLRIRLSRKQIESSPPLEIDAPVTPGFESALASHYGWPEWPAPVPPMVGSVGEIPAGLNVPQPPSAGSGPRHEPFVRSTESLRGEPVRASDGDIGQVDDFIVDVERWLLRYVVVDTARWLSGRKVLLAISWVDRVAHPDTADEALAVELTRAQVEKSPTFDPNELVNRATEVRLYDYYGRPYYW